MLLNLAKKKANWLYKVDINFIMYTAFYSKINNQLKSNSSDEIIQSTERRNEDSEFSQGIESSAMHIYLIN